MARASCSHMGVCAAVSDAVALRCIYGQYEGAVVPKGSESRQLESRVKAVARLDLEVSPSSRGLWGGHALLLHGLLLEN
jgi:hypothetical protein